MLNGDLEYLLCSLPYLVFQNTEEERKRVCSQFQKYAPASLVSAAPSFLLEHEASKYLSAKKRLLFRQINLNTLHQDIPREKQHRSLYLFASFLRKQKEDVMNMRRYRRTLAGSEPIAWPIEPGNPLEEEVQLLRKQWSYLEELSISNYANFNALVIYKIKLQILERWWQFDAQRGWLLYSQNKQNPWPWARK